MSNRNNTGGATAHQLSASSEQYCVFRAHPDILPQNLGLNPLTVSGLGSSHKTRKSSKIEEIDPIRFQLSSKNTEKRKTRAWIFFISKIHPLSRFSASQQPDRRVYLDPPLHSQCFEWKKFTYFWDPVLEL